MPRTANPIATRRLIAQITGLMLVIGLMVVAVVLYSARAMDSNAVASQSALVDNSLSQRLTQTLSELRSVAWWDEAVTKTGAKSFDHKWLDLEFGVFMTQSFHHDRVMVLDEHDLPVYGFSQAGSTSASAMGRDLALVRSLVAQVRGGANVSPRITDPEFKADATENSKFSNRRYGRSAAAVLDENGRGELAAVMAITPSVDMTLLKGRPRLLVSFIKLDDAYWIKAGREALLPDLGFARSLADQREGKYLLRTDNGHFIGVLRWTPKKPGMILMGNVLPIVLVALAMLTIIVAALGRRLSSATRALAAWSASVEELANHDALTTLPNRRMLQGEFDALAPAVARGDIRLAVAYIDVDRFKDINDTLGHAAGDQLICGIAARLRDRLQGGDLVARLGGDEFAVLRKCHAGADEDVELGRLKVDIRACFDSAFEVYREAIAVNASFGLVISAPGRPFDGLMREADIALYEAKAQGRSRGVQYVPEMGRKVEARRALEVDLRRAIAQREISVMYQPIIETSSGRITSVEALARWNSAAHGAVPPATFIPIAEEVGLMADLGRVVIERAVKDSLRWPQFATAINVSAAQLCSASMLHDLMVPITTHRVDPGRIRIEITESMLMENNEATRRTLLELQMRGITLAIDDFGTGYSSLAYIRDFPFDQLKIDRKFIQGIAGSAQGVAIVQAMVNFGRILGKDVVAEGIETEEDMALMLGTGCTHLQGYLFALPMRAEEIEQLAQGPIFAVAQDQGQVAKRTIGKVPPARAMHPPRQVPFQHR